MKRKITSFVLLLAMLVSIVAVLPIASAAAETTFKGTDVTLTDGILLNFYVEADDALGIDNAEKKDGKYVVTMPVAAKNMGDDVTAEFKAGATVVDSHTYSVADYAAGILAGNYDAETKALVTAMLNYGAAAQKYFKYETDALVGTPVTDTTALKAATVAPVAVEGDGFIGASLVLEGTMTLRFYFHGTVDAATVDGESAEVVADATEYCYVDVKVTPDAIDKAYTVVAGETTVKYSVLNYLQRNADNAALSEMVASIYAYSVAAEAYLAENCTHEGVEYKVTQLPTLFTKGLQVAHCDRCGEELRESIDETEAKINVINSTDETKLRASKKLSDVVSGGNHFYPTQNDPDGKSLFVEFSMLLNDSMTNNFNGSNMTFPGVYSHHELPSNQGRSAHWFYFRASGNQAKGSFELSNSNCKDYLGSVTCQGSDQSNYVIVDNFNGWHRFGVEFHQNTYIDGTTVTYDMKVSLYIDGVKVHEYLQKCDDGHYLLYTAEVTDDGVVYTELTDKYAGIYTYGAKVKSNGQTAYFVTADEHVSCGDDFLIKVQPVDDLYKEDFEVEDGVTVDGTVHYEVDVD